MTLPWHEERLLVDSKLVTLNPATERPEHLPRGHYFEPTLFTDVDPDSTLAQEEVFGPVQSIIAYDGGDDGAIAVANNSMFGLFLGMKTIAEPAT